jgi:SAM-dependent methyltransferase
MAVEHRHLRYEQLGVGYTARRQPDPRIAALVVDALGDARTVLNVGAGTGSYEPTDRTVVALEPSSTMISQRPAGAAPAVRGVAEVLPFGDDSFDAVMGILTVHHWRDRKRGFHEFRRVAPRRVVLTYEPDQSNRFWLVHDYLDAFADLEHGRPTVDEIAEGIGASRIVQVPVPADCIDGFMGAFWRRPEAYLDPVVQRSISSFGLVRPEKLQSGLERLAADLDSGEWRRRYAHLLGLDELDLGYRLIIAG